MPHLPLSTLVLALFVVGCAGVDVPVRRAYGPLAPIVGSMPVDDPGASFSFLVGGHLYGDPGTMSAVPAPTFLAMLLPIRSGADRFFVSLGDFVRAFEPEMLAPTREVFTWLDKPVWNAPGNHDYRRGAYEREFGAAFGSIRCGSAVLFMLNTEATPWSIDGEQLVALERAVAEVAADPALEHLFLCGHKVAFAAGAPRYSDLFDHCNGRDGWTGTSNVPRDVIPMLRELAHTKNVVWFAGDVGVSWSLSLFYDRHPDWQITCVATGLGSTRRDNLLRVTVGPGTECRIEPVPLAVGAALEIGEPVAGPIEDFGIAAWRTHFQR